MNTKQTQLGYKRQAPEEVRLDSDYGNEEGDEVESEFH